MPRDLRIVVANTPASRNREFRDTSAVGAQACALAALAPSAAAVGLWLNPAAPDVLVAGALGAAGGVLSAALGFSLCWLMAVWEGRRLAPKEEAP